jgi:hypothetical protein
MSKRRIIPLAILACLVPKFAAGSEKRIHESFQSPPVELPTGHTRYGDFIFLRDRNPNGYVLRNRRAENGDMALQLGVGQGRKGGQPTQDPSQPDRAELREVLERQLPYGTPVWYAFSMRLTTAERSPRRLILAQIKSPASHMLDPSPILALRLSQGILHATVEYEIDPLDRASLLPRRGPACPSGWTPAYLHKNWQVRVIVATAWPGGIGAAPETFRHCTKALRIHSLRMLPNVPKQWTSFALHVAPGPDGGGKAAIYAEGRLIAEVTGRIGHRMEKGRQFFKIGPYRDHSAKPLLVEIDDLRRGSTLESLGIAPPASTRRIAAPEAAAS